jgi:hypothetical protein
VGVGDAGRAKDRRMEIPLEGGWRRGPIARRSKRTWSPPAMPAAEAPPAAEAATTLAGPTPAPPPAPPTALTAA